MLKCCFHLDFFLIKKLYADLPYSTNESRLQEEFSNFGEIAEGNCSFCWLISNQVEQAF